jgi:hypothetical protein
MKEKPGSWRKKIKQHWVAIVVVAIVLAVVILLIVVGYGFDWTGFNGYNKVTITHTISGTNAGTTTRTEDYQPGKTLWDWLQLLFVPSVLTLGAVWFTARQNHDLQIAERQREAERELAVDKYREEALETYIDKMSELLLEKHLRKPQTKDDVRGVARVRTLRVLPGLDNERKRNVIQFLHESGLINKDDPIIDLHEADLRGASLDEAELEGANLSGAKLMEANLARAKLMEANLARAKLMGADLSRANLSDAYLQGANLSDADLRDAKLDGVDLQEANLEGATGISVEGLEKKAKTLKGATMPDGKLHS